MPSLANLRQRFRRRLMHWGWKFIMSIGEMRREYDSEGLTESEVAADPIVQFRQWFADAEAFGLGPGLFGRFVSVDDLEHVFVEGITERLHRRSFPMPVGLAVR